MRKDKFFKELSRKDYIIKATEIVKNEGQKALTIRRIANELNCTSANLYRYFENIDELFFYSQIQYLDYYIDILTKAEKNWKDVWDMHIGIWECYSRTAFTYPQAFNTVFFSEMSKNLVGALNEYYAIFPEHIDLVAKYLTDMLRTSDFFERDYQMCKKCAEAGVIDPYNAIVMNRMVCMLYKGYLKGILDNGIEESEIEDRVATFMRDVHMVIKNLAKDTLGHKELM